MPREPLEKIEFPSTAVLVAPSRMRTPAYGDGAKAMTLPAPAGPPIVLLWAPISQSIPARPFGNAETPSIFVPNRLCWKVFHEAFVTQIPVQLLPEIKLPEPEEAPPMVLDEALSI